jgi:hypothetical protein
VTDVVRNEDSEVVQWKVRWFAPTDTARNQASPFCMLHGAQFLETLDVDPEMLVATATHLVHGRRKLPQATIKDAMGVLRPTTLAEANGELACNECHADKPGERLLACFVCSRRFHEHCAAGNPTTNNAEWWCAECAATAHAGS